MPKGYQRRLLACGILAGLGFVALAAKLVTIQIRDRARLVAYAERQLQRTLVRRARRGEIFDLHGRPLAVSVDAPSLFANPREIEDSQAAARDLEKILGVSRSQLRKKLRRGGSYVWLRRKLTPAEKNQVEKLNLKGLGFVTESQRFYPKRELASSLLGFVGMDNRGLAGMELALESRIGGRAGRVRIERDARGRSVHPEAVPLRAPRDGRNVRLTVDEVLQYIVEKELIDQLRRTGARHAIGIMVEPATGRILAMATVPGFNPNIYGNFPAAQWRQRAVQDIYEPGSTFKLVTAAAYLEAGGDLQKRFFAENGLYRTGIGSYALRDHKKHGWLTAEEAVVVSSNIGLYKMAMEIGPAPLYAMARRFGFGTSNHSGFPGEERGILRPPRRWSRTSLAAVSIGQEVGATPLQMVMVAATIANGGVYQPPRIVESIGRGDRIASGLEPRPGRRVISAQTARRLAAIMQRVVEEGTGRQAAVPGYEAAGKTGTAQKLDPQTRTYSQDKYVLSFLGFIPFDNPRIALLVVMDEGKGPGGAWGGTVAAPVWRRIAWQTMRDLRVPPRGAQQWTVAGRIAGGDAKSAGPNPSFGEHVVRLASAVREALHRGVPRATRKEEGR